jgi:hypothetical protein
MATTTTATTPTTPPTIHSPHPHRPLTHHLLAHHAFHTPTATTTAKRKRDAHDYLDDGDDDDGDDDMDASSGDDMAGHAYAPARRDHAKRLMDAPPSPDGLHVYNRRRRGASGPLERPRFLVELA